MGVYTGCTFDVKSIKRKTTNRLPMIGALVIVHAGSYDCRLYFINRHFADLTELRDFTRLIEIMVKISMKSNETIYDHTSLPVKNAFNYVFPLRHTCLQRSPRISLFGIIRGWANLLKGSLIDSIWASLRASQ